MSYKDNFNVFVGGKLGVFKGIKIEKKANIIKNIQDLASITGNDQVTTISWGDDDEKDVLIACGEKEDRRVKIYDSENSAFIHSFLCNTGKGSINGISRYNGSILTAVNSGEVSLWRQTDKEGELLINAGENLNRMCHSHVQRNVIATGGREHILKLYDLEKQVMIFNEKNVRHDWLELKVPVWISDMNFLSGAQQIATVGRYGHIRLYDPRAQRRPVVNITYQDESFTCMCVTSKEKHIIAGSGKGKLNLVDLRKPGKILNTYKGFAGGVTGVACSMSNPYIASVSLDRYLRIHHIDTKQLLKNIYLTSKLTCLAMRSDFSIETDSEKNPEVTTKSRSDNGGSAGDQSSDDAASEAEYDELFNKMQVVDSKSEKVGKKRKLVKSVKEVSSNDCDIVSQKQKRKKRNQVWLCKEL
ncbi:WD repeat-containing protein 74 [Harpegnathos saltator]|uniref:WD repeat-containing protein 74 n=1 Tax=Harpegnathos saltator TaxID=610380 RepID=E2BA52_HARSA|nr:WD repeat-containing protein 74 [Harpegnathos saltator]EFN87461.1 WD repeat-containing protein 74 [Harpegnathos saltator]